MRSILIFGRRQEGKTTLAIYLARELEKSIIVFDPNSQVEIPGAEIVNDIVNLAEALAVDPIIIYRPESSDPKELQAEFDAVIGILWDRGHYVLFVDEAHWLQAPQSVNPSLAKYIRMAPRDVDVIQTMHAPADSWARGRSLATDWYMFRMTRPADLKAIEEQCGAEIAEMVSRLPRHHFIHYNVDEHKFVAISNPETWAAPVSSRPIHGRLTYAV